ncbi:MAG TPA: ribonuclease J [Dehalococcoidia bacterium]|nr:ribonuclease J [Dehalococcoidia bacterium]
MSTSLRIVPLGGLGEIGKNSMVFEMDKDIILVDAGLMFPEEEMLGVDLVIPDISYLLEHRQRVRGIIITHGHEDHTGALPYLLRQLQTPIYCPRLAHGLITVKLKEHNLLGETTLRVVQAGEKVNLGAFRVEFFQVAHSIPDSMGLIIHTPLGPVVHTGDFKLDHTPVMGQKTDLARLSRLGDEGALLLLSDSTYAETPGYTLSEQVVEQALEQIMATASGRVIIATLASLIARVQQIIDAAHRQGRRVFITGRNMQDNAQMARELGYIRPPDNVFIGVEELRRLPPNKIVVVTTGSQGEPTSALVRMANRDHRHVQIVPGDTVVLSASPIPGNEQLINRTVDNLVKLGAEVFYRGVGNVHVHGHAAQEELKLILSLVRPRYFIPVHGEYRHLVQHARLAQAVGIPRENTFVLEDGDILELDGKGASVVGKAPCDYVYVDGLGVGDVDHVVLRDRKRLAHGGIVVVIVAVDKKTGRVVGEPEVVARGLADIEESAELLEGTRGAVISALNGAEHIAEWGAINTQVKEAVARYLYERTRRRPLILPVAVEV